MSQQTTNYRPSAWLFPSRLHRCPEEFTVLFLQHLYGTESSVTLRSTQMFAQEVPSVKWTRQGTVGKSILWIRNKKPEIKCLLKILWKSWGWSDGEHGSHKWSQHCTDLRCSPADQHTALTCETLNEKIQAAGKNLPSLMSTMLAGQG